MRSPVHALLLLVPAALACSPSGQETPPRPRPRGAAVAVPATYDAALGAPACRQTGAVCYADHGILAGRGPLGPEPFTPNTLGGSCPDGAAGTYRRDPSLEGLAVWTPDGFELTAGGQALLNATFFVGPSPDTEALDLFIAADARSPQWLHLTTISPPAAAPGWAGVQIPITLLGGDLQAVRGVYRSGGSAVPTPCPGGPLDDVDDVAFAVAGGTPPPPPTPPLEAAVYDPSLMAPACTGAGYGCTSGDLLRRDPMAPVEPNAPNTLGMSCFDPWGTKDSWLPLVDAISVVTLEGSQLAAGKRVRVTAEASRLAPGAIVSLFHANHTRGSPWTLIGSLVASGAAEQLVAELTLPTGRHQAVRAVAGGQVAEMVCGGSDQDDLAFAVDSPLGLASWDPLLGVPACLDASPICESGALLAERSTELATEPNSPNMLEGCPDGPHAGPSGTSAPSIQALRVSSHDGLPLTSLHPVRVEATVRAEPTSVVDFYVNDGWMGAWRSLGRAQPAPGEQLIALSFVPLTSGTIAVRASIDLPISWLPNPGFCSSMTGYRDTDDLAFSVAPPDGQPPYVHPTVALTAPDDGSVMASLPLRLAADAYAEPLVQRVEFWVMGGLVGTRFEPPYELLWRPEFPPPIGSRFEVQARVYDGFGAWADSAVATITTGDLFAPEVAFAAHEPVVPRWWTTVDLVATDQWHESGVARIDLLSDGVPVGTLPSPPWTFSWDLSAAADGPHTLTAVAYDWAGNSAQAALTLTVDGTPPTGGVVIPAPGAHVRGIVPVTIVADDAHGPVWGPIYLDGWGRGYAFEDRPYLWNTALETDGPHELITWIADGVGNWLFLPRIPVVVDNAAPSVSLASPGPGAVVGGPVELTVAAEDPWGLALVQVIVAGNTVLSAAAPPYSTLWDPGTLAEGAHTLTASAIDRAGNVASASQSVLIDRFPPAVALVAPSAPGPVRGTVPLRASATDANGIALVEFWARDTGAAASPATLVAVATPDGDGYAASWDTALVPSGRYTLHARAVDGAGREAASPEIEVVVDNTAPAVSITSPAAGAVVAGMVRVVAAPLDALLPITGLQLVVDGDRSAAWLDAAAALEWDSTAAPNGPHTLQVRARDAAGNEGESPATAVQVLNPPPPGTQLLFDTGFEAASAGPWVAKLPSVFQVGTSPAAHGGATKAALGGRGTSYTDFVQQTFVVPATATTLRVKFWLRVKTSERTDAARDRLQVRLLDAAEGPIGTLGTYANNGPSSWASRTLTATVAGHRGTAVTLAFEATEDSARQTTFFVDDVTITWSP